MAIKDTAEAAVAKSVMKLPTPALRRMAGAPTVIDGRTLDVRLQLAAKASADGPSMASLEPSEARAGAAAAFATTNARRTAGVSVHERSIGDDLRIRISRPADATGLRPGVLFMHQGGFVLGDLETNDAFCSRLAADLGAIVVNLDYRLAPEHRYPAQSDDADTAWAWINDHAEGLGLDTSKLVVCGDSAGGQMSAALCQRLRDAGSPQPAVQALVYPLVDAAATEGSMQSCADAFPLTAEVMDYFFEHALPEAIDRADPVVSPARAATLEGLAPAVVVTAGFDPLRDQGIAYAEALRAAGVRVIDRCEDSLSHSFLSFGGLVPEARAATSRLIADIETLLR